METLLLNKDEVGSLIDLDRVQAAVEDAYRSFNSGKVTQPPFMALHTPQSHGGMDIKAGIDMGSGFMTIKASSGGYDANPGLGLPRGMNTVLLFDAATSALRCVMDGTWITGCRTGAAGAISAKYLARKDAKVVGIIGAGNQARRQLRAVRRVRDIREVYVWNASRPALDAFVQEMHQETGHPFTPAPQRKRPSARRTFSSPSPSGAGAPSCGGNGSSPAPTSPASAPTCPTSRSCLRTCSGVPRSSTTPSICS